MKTINGQIFYDLYPYLDFIAMDAMLDDIHKTIAKNYHNIGTSGSPQSTFYDKSRESFHEKKSSLPVH